MNLRPAVPASAAPTRRPLDRALGRAPLAALGLVTAMALGGCTIPGMSAPPTEETQSSGADAGAGWHWYKEGKAVGSASNRPAWPAAATSTSTLPPAAPAAPTAPAASSSPMCASQLDALTKPVGATGGVGQGTLTWTHVNDPSIVEYRVAAVLQDFGAGDDVSTQTWITVARPAAGCEEMTATVTGLIAGRYYVFWLDAVLSGRDGTVTEPMIGRSSAVLVE